MHRVSIWNRPGPLTVLCLGAHSDDIEIGCGGAILRLIAERPDARCHWVVFSRSGDAQREAEARASAAAVLGDAAAQIDVHDFRDAYFPYEGGRIKDVFEGLKRRLRPDVIFTHARDDLHQDHRLVCELTGNTFRDHLILEYEVPKYDGDLGRPGVFIPLTEDQVQRKIELLMHHFGSQRSRAWFAPETFRGLLRIRGLECNAPSGYAEAFHCRKCVV